MRKVSYRVEKCLELETSVKSFNDLSIFLTELIELDETASKETHYHELDKWMDPVYGLIRKQLEKYGFIEAAPSKGKTQPMDAEFWWAIYAVLSSVCYSMHLKSQTAYHHSSAWERNQALMGDIQDIIELKSNETIV